MNADFTKHEFTLNIPVIGEPIYLIPFGDVHYGANGFHAERFDEFCEWAKKKKGAYFIGMGDYTDMGSDSEKLILGDKKLHDDTRYQLNEIYKKQAAEFAKKIKFMEGRLIGLIQGNHGAELLNGTTVDQYICDLLNCKYLGSSSMIWLGLSYKPGHSTRRIILWAHHGKGGGMTAGSPINTIEKMEKIALADIYLMGHTHTKGVVTTSQLELTKSSFKGNLELHQRKRLFVSTGSFLKSYEDGKPSYVAKRALRPSDLGTAKIEITLKRKYGEREGKQTQNFHVDYHASV